MSERQTNLGPRGENQRVAWVFLVPFLLVFVAFTVWPLALAVVLSLRQTYGPGAWVYVGFSNFAHLASDSQFYVALRNTLVFTAASVFVQLPLALGLAMLLNRRRLLGKGLFRLIFFSPQLVGLVFVAIMARVMFEKRTGLVNQSLHTLIGLDLDFPWLDRYVMSALVLTALWLYVGLNMIYFLAALQNVPDELVEASSIDGAGPLDRFRHVTIPAIRPVAGFVVLLSIIGSLQLFELPFIMFDGGGPESRALTLVTYLYQTGFEMGDLGYASAIGWMLALLLIGFTIGQRFFAGREVA